MVSIFHLAFPVTDLDSTRKFYGSILGCKEGRSAPTWVDFDFFGHQISAHIAPPDHSRIAFESDVEDKKIPVPHFGLIVPWDDFDTLAERLRQGQAEFVLEPFIRFRGKPGEQKTMFVRDFSKNSLEFKSFRSSDEIYRTD